MKRFVGGCESIAAIDVGSLVDWISSIPFEEWPQQHRLSDGRIRPSMVTDPSWFSFGNMTAETVRVLMGCFPGCVAFQKMLSVVMPGHSITPHRDEQPKSWICRVHVPLISNDASLFIVGGNSYSLIPGVAYRVNTEAEHSVVNDGDTPRTHLMFDVRTPC